MAFPRPTHEQMSNDDAAKVIWAARQLTEAGDEVEALTDSDPSAVELAWSRFADRTEQMRVALGDADMGTVLPVPFDPPRLEYVAHITPEQLGQAWGALGELQSAIDDLRALPPERDPGARS